MHTDIRSLDDGTVIECDFCIIGAGPAGIAVALDLATGGGRIALLEGGGFERDARVQDRLRGELAGHPYYPLEHGRLQYLGGATGHWGGLCSELVAEDLCEREGVPLSGWPIGMQTLRPWYTRARRFLGADSTGLPAGIDRNPVGLGDSGFLGRSVGLSRPLSLGGLYRPRIDRAERIALYTHARVTRLIVGTQDNAIEVAEVRTSGGRRHSVHARRFVLAGGTVENARLLLASSAEPGALWPAGNNWVGRCFMEHLEVPVGEVRFASGYPEREYMADCDGASPHGELVPTEGLRRHLGILGCAVSIRESSPGREDDRSLFDRFPPERLERAAIPAAPVYGRKRRGCRRGRRRAEAKLGLYLRLEQAPARSSRVTLSGDSDALGMPRPHLAWWPGELERYSLHRITAYLPRAFGRSGIARVRVPPWARGEGLQRWPSTMSGAWHHMGTLRMAQSPEYGVVDPDCRVHGTRNLYVAGAAVFPTGGAANPTLTLVALALRLAAHLQGAEDA